MSALTHTVRVNGEVLSKQGLTEHLFPQELEALRVVELIKQASELGWTVTSANLPEPDQSEDFDYELVFTWNQSLAQRVLMLVVLNDAVCDVDSEPEIKGDFRARLLGSNANERNGVLKQAGWTSLVNINLDHQRLEIYLRSMTA